MSVLSLHTAAKRRLFREAAREHAGPRNRLPALSHQHGAAYAHPCTQLYLHAAVY
jgi:hypothetical protein